MRQGLPTLFRKASPGGIGHSCARNGRTVKTSNAVTIAKRRRSGRGERETRFVHVHLGISEGYHAERGDRFFSFAEFERRRRLIAEGRGEFLPGQAARSTPIHVVASPGLRRFQGTAPATARTTMAGSMGWR